MGQLEQPFVFVLSETFGWQIGRSLNSLRFHDMSVLYVRNRRSLIRQMQRYSLFDTHNKHSDSVLSFARVISLSPAFSGARALSLSLSPSLLLTHTSSSKPWNKAINKVIWHSRLRAKSLSCSIFVLLARTHTHTRTHAQGTRDPGGKQKAEWFDSLFGAHNLSSTLFLLSSFSRSLSLSIPPLPSLSLSLKHTKNKHPHAHIHTEETLSSWNCARIR